MPQIHQHANAAQGQTALAHVVPGTELATSYGGQEIVRSTDSTAPWKNPRAGKCAAKNNTCNGNVSKKCAPYCSGHGLSMGLITRDYRPVTKVQEEA